MIIEIDESTLSPKNGNKVSLTRILVKCDDENCSVEQWGNWANYKNNELGPHYCITCRNKRGLNGLKGKKQTDHFKKLASERMKKNNPTKDAKVRQKISEKVKKSYENRPGNFYGQKRPEHAKKQSEFMKQVYAVTGKDADFRKDLREKYVTSNRRISKLQQRVAYSLELAGYDKFEMEQSISDDDNNIVYVVDLLWPEKKIIIAVNGSFFHASEELYNDDDMIFNKTAKEVREKDKKQYDFLKSMGYNIIVIWEHKFPKGKKLDYPWDDVLCTYL